MLRQSRENSEQPRCAPAPAGRSHSTDALELILWRLSVSFELTRIGEEPGADTGYAISSEQGLVTVLQWLFQAYGILILRKDR